MSFPHKRMVDRFKMENATKEFRKLRYALAAKGTTTLPSDNDFNLPESEIEKLKSHYLIKDPSFYASMFQKAPDGEEYLRRYPVMIAIMNLVGIKKGKPFTDTYSSLSPIFYTKNLLDSNRSDKLYHDDFLYTLRALIDICNDILDKDNEPFRVPNDVFNREYKTLEGIYEDIAAYQLEYSETQLVRVNNRAVMQKNVTYLYRQYASSFNKGEERLADNELLVPLNEFLDITKNTTRDNHKSHDIGRHFAYIQGGSDITASKIIEDYIEEYVRERKSNGHYGMIIMVDVSRVTKETTFLRSVLAALCPDESPENINTLSLHELKNRLEFQLAMAEKSVLWVLTARSPGLDPKTLEFGKTIDRSFVETVLSDLAHKLEKRPEHEVRMRVIVAVKGEYHGYQSPWATKVTFPPPDKSAWVAYCEHNGALNGNNSEQFAARIIRNIPGEMIQSSVVNALLCLDEYIKFDIRKDAVQLYKNGVIQEAPRSVKYSYYFPENGDSTDQIPMIPCNIDWRMDMHTALVNCRTPQRFAKILCFYLLYQRKLNLYFLLLAIAYSDDGLRLASMESISRILKLGLTRQDIEGFLKAAANILVMVDRTLLPDDEGYIEEQEAEQSWEVMEPLKQSLTLHSHAYFDLPEYAPFMENIHKCRFGDEPARVVDKEEIHFGLGQLSFNLFRELTKKTQPGGVLNAHPRSAYNASSFKDQMVRRSRLRYLSFSIKHLLRAVGSGAINQPQKRVYLTNNDIESLLSGKSYSDMSASLLINTCWRLYFYGLEQQRYSQNNFEFDQNSSNNNSILSTELIRHFCSVGYRHEVSYFHVPVAFRTSLDDASYLRFLTTAAVNFWTSAQNSNLHHCYEHYLMHYGDYFRWNGNSVVTRVLEGNPVAFYARESCSRISLLHIRALLDKGLFMRAKNLINEFLKDHQTLIRCCLNQISEAILGMDLDLDCDSLGLEYDQKHRLMQCVALLSRIQKKRIRLTSALVYICTVTGNFDSAYRHFLQTHLFIEQPVNSILSALDKGSDRKVVNDVLKKFESSYFSFVMQNKTLFYCMYFILSKKQHDETIKLRWESSKEESDAAVEQLYYSCANGHDVVFQNKTLEEKTGNSSLKKPAKDRICGQQKVLLADYSSSQDNFHYETLKDKTVQYLQQYLESQSSLLVESENPTADVIKDKKQYVRRKPKPEDYYLIMTLVRNAKRVNIIDEEEAAPFKAITDYVSLQRLLDTTVARYSRHIANRSGLEAYRYKVINLNKTERFKLIKPKDTNEQTEMDIWLEHDQKWVSSMERSFADAGSEKAVIELKCLKAWHIKLIIAQLDQMLLTYSSELLIDNHDTNENKNEVLTKAFHNKVAGIDEDSIENKLYDADVYIDEEQIRTLYKHKKDMNKLFQQELSDIANFRDRNWMHIRAWDIALLSTESDIDPLLMPVAIY